MLRTGAFLAIVVLSVLPFNGTRAAESPTAEAARQANEVRKKLAATITFPGIEDPETKLDDALGFLLGRVIEVRFEINDQAFRDENIDDVRSKVIGREIPKLTNTSAESILRRMLARIPSSSGTTFVVRGGIVEITTRRYASPSAWRIWGPEVGSVVPAETSVVFEKRELQGALQEIADATGVNIVLDARAADQGKMAITTTMRAVGVDTAVRLLADMAGLSVAPVDNVLYVTTKENAKVLLKELEKRARQADLAGM